MELEDKQDEMIIQPEAVESQVDSSDEPAQTDVQADTEAESGELEVSIEGESPPPEQDSSVIRELRKAYREAEKERKRLREELEAVKNPKQEVGSKPTLEQFDYDADAFETALISWNERKRQAESEAAKQQESQAAAQRVYAERLHAYEADKRASRIAGIDEAEDAVRSALNDMQQSILVRYSSRPAVLVKAIGANPETAKRIAAITDPIEFAFAVRDLESKVKTTPRKPPAPETRIASAGQSVPYEVRLKQLREQADKTGNSTEVVRFMRAQKTGVKS